MYNITYEDLIFEMYFKLCLKIIEIKSSKNALSYEEDISKWGQIHSLYFSEIITLHENCQSTNFQNRELEIYDYYCGYGYIRINNMLRKLEDKTDYIVSYANDIENSINKFFVTEDVITFRRVKKNHVIRYTSGVIIEERGFISTSLNKNYRLNSQGHYMPLRNEAILIIEVSKGINAVYLEEALPKDRRRGEHELLIKNAYKFEVISNTKIFSNRIIHLKLKSLY